MDTHKTNVATLTISRTFNICTEIKLNLYSQRVNTVHVDTRIADRLKAKKLGRVDIRNVHGKRRTTHIKMDGQMQRNVKKHIGAHEHMKH